MNTRVYLLMLFSCILSFLFSTSTFAGNQTITAEVKRIYPSGNDRLYFSLKEKMPPEGTPCSAKNGNYYYFSISHSNANAWLSMLLAAATTNSKISVTVPACTTSDAIDFIKINYLFQSF